MFNIGIGELLVVLVVAFVIVGPDDLPKVARWLGRQVRRIRVALQELKAETGWDELEKEVKEVQKDIKQTVKEMDVTGDIRDAVNDARKEVNDLSRDMKQDFRQLDQSLSSEMKTLDDELKAVDAGTDATVQSNQDK